MEDAHKALGSRPLSTVWVVKLDRTVGAGSVCGVNWVGGKSMPVVELHAFFDLASGDLVPSPRPNNHGTT